MSDFLISMKNFWICYRLFICMVFFVLISYIVVLFFVFRTLRKKKQREDRK
jgi:uncharacterized membrane protein